MKVNGIAKTRYHREAGVGEIPTFITKLAANSNAFVTKAPLNQVDAMSKSGSMQGMAALDAYECRMAIRRQEYSGPTAGLAAGCVQANLMILPEALAGEFLLFCQRNPKPCPLLAVSEPGQFAMPALGRDIDLRTDVPKYRVWHKGELTSQPADLRDVWRDDLVSFAIGCSFSFEEALLAEGIEIRHVSQGVNVPMYRTNIATASTATLNGPLVVSMRPMNARDAIRAIQVTSRFPAVHGAPVHIGDPALIGIVDINRPDYGDAVVIKDDEIPVFWACGVTPQSVINTVKPEFSITHAPGHMLITDMNNAGLASF